MRLTNSSNASVLWFPTPSDGTPEHSGASPGSPRIILIEPAGGANVGAACRAIKNMGGGSLVTVRGDYDREQARRMAVHAADVLHSSEQADTLQQALCGCGTVVGTTAHSGPYRSRAVDIQEIARELVAGRRLDERPFAFVFGPEDRGLSNKEVALCHRLATIPASNAYVSLNLSQAVMICLYEVRCARAEWAGSATAGVGRTLPADAAALEGAYAALEEALLAIGFLSEENPAHIMATIRSLVGRSVPDEREVKVLRGLARQILWFADGGREVAVGKRERGKKLR